MKPNLNHLDQNRLSPELGSTEGLFIIQFENRNLRVISSTGMGWDHVSVSLENRCPNWREMCFIKDLFFDEEETVIQFHPKKSEYVNNHPYCLHPWRPQDFEIKLPDSMYRFHWKLVGVKNEI